MAPSNELQNVLDEVSQSCLGGQPVPEDLAALWAAQLLDDTDLLDAYEMTLFEAADEDILDGFRVEDGVEPAAAAAYERMAQQVRWIADVFDGSLIGYWVGDQRRPVADSPIVIVDADGQFDLGGRTLADFLLEQTDPEDADDFNDVRNALEAMGVAVRVKDHEEIWSRLADFDEPNELVMGYLLDARMRAGEAGEA
jgi:nucleotide-binding universal stress UspA family protein